VGIKGNLLLLCVAEQYRGAVKLSETEGLRKSIWVIITFTMMFRNSIAPLAVRLFVESRRSRLVSGTDKNNTSAYSLPRRARATSVKCGYAQDAHLCTLLPLSRHEPQALWLYGYGISLAYSQQWLYGFNPFPLRDFPYLVSLAGAEKITLRLTWA